jgi:NAD(P)-dependent dehydrogenase (short-subunit alcohol dehydrogenase family)
MRIAGHDVTTDSDGVRSVIGVTGQFSAVDNLLTGTENLQLMADLRHLGPKAGRQRIRSCWSSSTWSKPGTSSCRPTPEACPAARSGHDAGRPAERFTGGLPHDRLGRRAQGFDPFGIEGFQKLAAAGEVAVQRGHPENVSSDTARAPEPGQGAYAASKAAVSAFTASMAHEVVTSGVHLHVLYPGRVPTWGCRGPTIKGRSHRRWFGARRWRGGSAGRPDGWRQSRHQRRPSTAPGTDGANCRSDLLPKGHASAGQHELRVGHHFRSHALGRPYNDARKSVSSSLTRSGRSCCTQWPQPGRT